MLKIIAVISILSLAAIIFVLLFNKNKTTYLTSFIGFVACIFITEVTLFATALIKMNNLWMINIGFAVYFGFSLWLLHELKASLQGHAPRTRNFFIALGAIAMGGWFAENFYFNVFSTYNPFGFSAISLIQMLLAGRMLYGIYRTNMGKVFNNPTGLVLAGLIIRFFSNAFVSPWLSLEFRFSGAFYYNVVVLSYFFLVISNMFLLTAMLWLLMRKNSPSYSHRSLMLLMLPAVKK